MRKYSFKRHQLYLLILALALSVFGIVMIGSAQENLQKTQMTGLLLGIVLMLVASLINYQWILRFYWAFYAAALLLLLAVYVFGDSSHGATRWVDLGFIQFQPSELCKILFILFFAKFFSTHKNQLSRAQTILVSLALIAVPAFLILRQPDLSTTIIILLTFAFMMFVAGLKRKIVLTVLAVMIPCAFLGLFIATRENQPFLADYQQNRILAWLYPEEYTDEEAMQQQNSIIAIGSGQLTGKGLNNDEVNSLKNGNFVPEPQTDFIFAVVGEELGFVGCFSVILLLLLTVLTCFAIGKKSDNPAGKLICSGMGALIGFQSFINISVTTGLCPITGITLPFISYGLTSLISLYIGLGVVMNVSMQPLKYERQVRIL